MMIGSSQPVAIGGCVGLGGGVGDVVGDGLGVLVGVLVGVAPLVGCGLAVGSGVPPPPPPQALTTAANAMPDNSDEALRPKHLNRCKRAKENTRCKDNKYDIPSPPETNTEH
jgi:hypothetical protein